ncbi:autotransporter domain-containing protein [Sphingorhabdus sp. YGSMI21]|uniref:autotransporter domain-containing protein n=1 Tax=Sphingorhabdus sp. YGSMI21 TaxID=2077182 RepID=UPI000F5088DB|nr:autotransporter domain-containing protein [Sphingorhabdus sp. YGSMI21]
MRTAAAGAIATLALASPAKAIVPGQNETSESIVDEDGGVNGVGQMVISNGGGSVGLCTGTLINPRTVIFAAHCVNSRPEDAYGSNTGGVPISFGFAVDNFPAILNWFGSGFSTNTADFLYNVNQVNWNIASAPTGFLEADVALATLDTPAADIPTWAILFSALPDPGAIDSVTGTGYHVNQTGYGGTGNAVDGAVDGIDFRRRLVENYLGALASLNDLGEPLVGPEPFGADFPQNLYWADFDSIEDANGNRSVFSDFNWLRDEALPNEGTTAGGDSGGPLVLDAANNAITSEDLVLGVLSGGAGFLGGSDQLGSASFYQPLFQFWDYIAANNAYHYVTANAGDGDWEDGSHWTSLLDPNYRIIDESGAIVNGIPTTEPGGVNAVEPDFGAVCIQGPVVGAIGGNVCIDLSDGEITPTDPAGDDLPAAVMNNGGAAAGSVTVLGDNSATVQLTDGTSPLANNSATVEIEVAAADDAGATVVSGAANAQFSEPVLESHAEGDPLPAPTIANGLPGATDFVPNNVDPDGLGAAGAYYDVTLSNAGITTLGSTVEIDRLTVSGAAGLDITADGSLTSLIDVTQAGGMVNIDGSLTSVGDYFLMAGLLSGTGSVNTPFLTNVMGGIAPGTMGTIGTLTVNGNTILSSGSTLLVDIGASGDSDLLAVNGAADLGGTVVFSPVSGFQTATASNYQILTATDGVTDEFDGAAQISAILLSEFSYSANAVDVTISAQSYQNVIAADNAVQVSFAALMDNNRGNTAVADLFTFLDFTDAGTIQATFDSWAPTTESTVQAMGQSFLGNVSDFYQNRISLAERSSNGGTIAVIGRPMQLAATSLGGLAMNGASVLSDAAANADDTEVRSGGVNEDMAVYLAGGFVNGDGGSMPLTNPAPGSDGEDEFDGFFIAGGLEYYLDEASFIGVSAYYSDVDATAALGNTAQSTAIMGSIYGRKKMSGGLVLDGRATVGTYNAETLRTVSLGTQSFSLTTDDDSMVYAAELGLSKEMEMLDVIAAPGIRARAAKINFSNVDEQGGGPALTIIRPDYESIQGLAGIEFKSKPGRKLQMRASMNYVHEFQDNPNSFGANFVGGNGAVAPFALAERDKNWGEVGVGLRYNMGNVSFDLSADSTVGRSDVSSQLYSGAISFRF